jgi:hypothetical protein
MGYNSVMMMDLFLVDILLGFILFAVILHWIKYVFDVNSWPVDLYRFIYDVVAIIVLMINDISHGLVKISFYHNSSM